VSVGVYGFALLAMLVARSAISTSLGTHNAIRAAMLAKRILRYCARGEIGERGASAPLILWILKYI